MPDETNQQTEPGVEAQVASTTTEQQETQLPSETETLRKAAEEANLKAAKLEGMLEAIRNTAKPGASGPDPEAVKAQIQQLKDRIAADPTASVDIMFQTLEARDAAWQTRIDQELAKRDQYWGGKIAEANPEFRELQPIMERLSKNRVWEFLSPEDRIAMARDVASIAKPSTRATPQGSPAGTQARGSAAPAAEQGETTGDPRLDATLARVYGDQPKNTSIWGGR